MLQNSLDLVFRRRRGIWARLEGRTARRLEALLAGGAAGPLALELSPSFMPHPKPLAQPRNKSRLGRLLRGLGLGLLLSHAAFFFATSLLILSYRFADPSVTILMAYRKWGYDWKLEPPRPLALSSIPSYIRSMLVSVEDGKFYEHHGLDFEAFRRAYEVNARLNRRLYGGSTLTMQVARTLFLVPEKSYLRKYLEIYVALELELFLSKERILELYFGYAEWGKGIFGIDAAARKYFGRGVARLSRDQAARLIALLSSPIKYGPGSLEKSGILRERYQYLQRRYLGAGKAATEAKGGEVAPAAASTPAPSPPADAATGAEIPTEAAPLLPPGAADSESTETAPLPLPFKG